MRALRKYAILVICFIEATLLGCALFGWASLVFVLQEDGLYSYLCQSPTNSISPVSTNASSNLTNTSVLNQVDDEVPVINMRCPEQKIMLSVPYTVIIVVFGITALPIGLFFDRFGLRTTRTIAAIIGAASYVLLAIATPGNEWLLLVAAAGIGMSGYTVLMTISYVALIAETKVSLMTGINNAGVATAFTYPAVKLAYDAGVSRMVSLNIIAGLWGIVLLSSWCLLPAFKLDEELKAEKEEVTSGKSQDRNGMIECASKALRPVSVAALTKTNGPITSDAKYSSQNTFVEHENGKLVTSDDSNSSRLRTYMLSATFILFLGWFCILHLRVGVMISGYDAWISEIVKGDIAKVSYYTDVMAYAVLGGVLTTPIPGLITDYMRAKLSSEIDGTATALIPALAVSSLLLGLLTACLLVSSESVIIPAVIIFAVGKPCMYSTATFLIALLAPQEHFGVVYGMVNLVAGLASFLIYPFFIWVTKAGSFLPLNALLLTATVLTLILPVKLTFNRFQRKRHHVLHKFPPGVTKSSHL